MTPNDEENLKESLKLEFEMHKHFTTVMAGLGVVLLTILQGFFVEKSWSAWEDFFAIGCFVILSVGGLCSIVAMQSVLKLVRDTNRVNNEKKRYRYARATPGYALPIAIFFFLVFAGMYMNWRL